MMTSPVVLSYQAKFHAKGDTALVIAFEMDASTEDYPRVFAFPVTEGIGARQEVVSLIGGKNNSSEKSLWDRLRGR